MHACGIVCRRDDNPDPSRKSPRHNHGLDRQARKSGRSDRAYHGATYDEDISQEIAVSASQSTPTAANGVEPVHGTQKNISRRTSCLSSQNEQNSIGIHLL